MKKKCLLAIGISLVMAFSETAFAGAVPIEKEATAQLEWLKDSYEIEAVGKISSFNADTYFLKHKKSGASIYIIDNDDTEKTFNIMYRTPYTDESDTNHVFEHAVLASSKKYPSKNIFFDMMSKTYATYASAYTYSAFTCFPLASQSEEQLLKMIDVDLSCLTEPELLENENIFKREAIRYELYSRDEPITMKGTVFSEDFGYLTDIDSETGRNIGKALYPGQTAGNALGMAHIFYKDLNYEKLIATYDRYYSFDNSLIILYGDMNFENVLSFLDKEYLSKAENKHTDLSMYTNEEDTEGFVKQVYYSPAYEGDKTENASNISYAFSLWGEDWDTLLEYNILAALLKKSNSVLKSSLLEEGINNNYLAECELETAKPYFNITIENAEENQMDAFERAVQKTLAQVSENGIPREQYDVYRKQEELRLMPTGGEPNLGAEATKAIGSYWAATGYADIYEKRDMVYDRIFADDDQTIIKNAAKGLLEAKRSCLIATVPKAGLAEQIEEEMEAYLAEKKAAMSEQEIDKMIEDTLAFNEWNESEQSNSDFTIPVEDLPEYDLTVPYEKEQKDGITWYKSPIPMGGRAAYQFLFDAGEISKEDMPYVPLFMELVGSLNTKNYTKEQLAIKRDEYMSGFYADFNTFPSESANGFTPYINFSFQGLSEENEEAVSLLLEMLRESDFSQTQQVLSAMEGSLIKYNLSKVSSPSEAFFLAVSLSGLYNNDGMSFTNYATGQDEYYFMEDIYERLKTDPSYGAVFAEKMNDIAEKVISRGNMIVTIAASEESLDNVSQNVASALHELPTRQYVPQKYEGIEQTPQKYAVIAETSGNFNIIQLNIKAEDGLRGEYIPFLYAIKDKVMVQKLRFENGAYDTLTRVMPTEETVITCSYSDPNVKTSFEILESMGNEIANINISQEELDDYILSAYASVTYPMGLIDKAQVTFLMDMRGINADAVQNVLEEIKNARVEDKENAAEYFKEQMKKAAFVTVGNKNAVEKDKEFFDKVDDYRKN